MRKKTQTPLVSVVLPAHNAAAFIHQTIQSIVDQSYTNWELIIVDDYSTDNTWSIAVDFAKKDKRVKLYKNPGKTGVASAANCAHRCAKGTYIARIDADDVALPDRLEKQVAFLLENPDVVVVGGQCTVIDADNIVIGKKTFPTDDASIRAMSLWAYPVQQPTLMFNCNNIPDDFNWYPEDVRSAEEHELLFRLMQYGKIANLPDTLIRYRVHDANTSGKHPKKDYLTILSARVAAVLRYGVRPSLKAIAINVVQLIAVSVIPEKQLFAAYTRVRGMNSSPSRYETSAVLK